MPEGWRTRIPRNNDDDEDHRPIIIEFCGRIDAQILMRKAPILPKRKRRRKSWSYRTSFWNPFRKSNDTRGGLIPEPPLPASKGKRIGMDCLMPRPDEAMEWIGFVRLITRIIFSKDSIILHRATYYIWNPNVFLVHFSRLVKRLWVIVRPYTNP